MTVSDNVKAQIGNQRSTKYRDGSASITIVDPRDDELQRSYQETVVTGEGEDATVEVKTYSNYATYTGWNTEEYGQGTAITPGSTRTISELANKCGDSHLRMLYEKRYHESKKQIELSCENSSAYRKQYDYDLRGNSGKPVAESCGKR